MNFGTTKKNVDAINYIITEMSRHDDQYRIWEKRVLTSDIETPKKEKNIY